MNALNIEGCTVHHLRTRASLRDCVLSESDSTAAAILGSELLSLRHDARLLDGPHDWIRALFIKGKMLSGRLP